jgi:SAM-dependent methyltransferase
MATGSPASIDRRTGPRPYPPDSCLWCGDVLDAAEQDVFRAVVCRSCGVATTVPWPSDEQLEAAYGEWYRPNSGRFSGPGDYILRWSRGRLARRVDRLAPPGAVLDVGAGDGTLVDALRRRGRDTLGIERNSTGPFIEGKDIEDVSGQWAAVVFWHSLEHLRRPAEALAHAVTLLEPGGLLVVAVPNGRSLQARVFRHDWFALDLPRHLVHLDDRALRRRLAELGMTVQRVSFTRGGQVFFGWVYGLARHLPGQPDIYAALRRPGARQQSMRASRRVLTILAAILVTPAALIGCTIEVGGRAGGTVFVEARR